MRLVAMYIKEHFLFEKPQTINFGGKNIYTFKPVDGNENEIVITKTKNPDFIDNFWGENISLVSAIVGANGVGKTKLLEVLKDNYEKILILIYEEYKSDKIFFDNKNKRFTFLFDSDLKDKNTKDKKSNIYNELIFNKDKAFIDKSKLLFTIESNREISMFSENIFSYDPTKIEIEIDSKIETETKQFEKQLFFLSDNELTNVLNNTFNRNINFFKKIKIKPIAFDTYFNRIGKNIFNRINDDSDSRKIPIDIFTKLSFQLKSNDLNNINILIISKFILFRFEEMMNKEDRLIQCIKFNQWLHNEKMYEDLQNSIKVISNIDKILKFETENYNKDILNEFLVFYNLIKESLQYDIEKDKIHDILKIHESHNTFNKLIDKKISMNFYKGFLIFESIVPISQGEEYLIKLFSNLHAVKDKNYQFIFLDEADLGFHPYWKKKFVDAIVEAIPIIFENSKTKPIQIIFTTHDPLTLSDIPNSNVVYLKKEGDKTIVLEGKERPQKSFGANITDLLADSFFIEDGLIGDFAKSKIKEVIDWLKSILKIRDELIILKLDEVTNLKKIKTRDNLIIKLLKEEITPEINGKINLKYSYYEKTIKLIDEPILKMKLLEMYDLAVKSKLREQILEEQISKMQEELENIKRC